MDTFVDYYAVLQIHSEAEKEVIDAAFRKLAQKYHPDHNDDPNSGDKMRMLNLAYAVLRDPLKRNEYHRDWLRQIGNSDSKSATPIHGLPKPLVDPTQLDFRGVKRGEIREGSFLVMNIGGPYQKVDLESSAGWLRIVNWKSISSIDELPLRVTIQVISDKANQLNTGKVLVRLDGVSAELAVRMKTAVKIVIRDHRWLDLDYEDLKGWVKNHKYDLDAGQEVKGKTFSYRLDPKSGHFQVRLRHKYTTGVYDSGS